MLKDLPNNSMNTDNQQPRFARLLLAGYADRYTFNIRGKFAGQVPCAPDTKI